VEALVLRRAAASPFAAGYVVFPGGTVDEGDAELAERWFGDPGEAARACAVRELAEEAGLVLAHGGVRALGAAEDPVAALDASMPRREDIHPMARWLAPEFLAVRFDAEFFSAGAPDGSTVEEVLALRVEQDMSPASPLALRVSPEWRERAGGNEG